MLRIGVIKTGNIASSLVLELLLDERADRNDIEVRVVTSGAKMSPEDCKSVVKKIFEFKPELILYSTPNPAAPGPGMVIEELKGKRAIIIGDAPGIKIKDELEKAGFGYILVKGDSLIGARREFLDPTEMALFNADMLRVLAVTGALRVMQEEIDRTIDGIKTKKEYLPRIIVDSSSALERSGIKNPYARAKALAAYELAKKVGELDVKGCFAVKEHEKYIPLVASAHEMLRAASRLAEEVREIEKGGDEVHRTPHSPDGRILRKSKLMEKPK